MLQAAIDQEGFDRGQITRKVHHDHAKGNGNIWKLDFVDKIG